MKWEFPAPISPDILSSYQGISPFLAELLYRRGVKPEDTAAFLYSEKRLGNPLLLPDMEKAIDRIFEAHQKDEKVCIWGDYDTDGLTSQAVLFYALKEWGFKNIFLYTPNRLTEGYGLNSEGLRMLAREGVTLTIALDLGTSNKEEVEDGRDEEMDIIIVDHHTIPRILPQPYAFINPHLNDNAYGYDGFAACGLTYMLVRALTTRFGPLTNETTDILRSFVVIGTVGDMAPLTGENRLLVVNGFDSIHRVEHAGLESLIAINGLKKEFFREENVGFGVSPPINAAGRFYYPEIVRNVLLSRDYESAHLANMVLKQTNQRRKDTLAEMLVEAVAQVEGSTGMERIIIVKNENWGAGVVGLIAGKLTDRYHRPAIALTGKLSNWKGSARSIPGFDIAAALRGCESLLGPFGGHPAAAGLELKRENLDAFHQCMIEQTKNLPDEFFLGKVKIDMIIPHDRVNRSTTWEIQKMAPFGIGNEEPVFLFKDVKVVDSSTMSDGVHLKANIKFSNGKVVEAVKFYGGHRKWMLVNGKKYDFCGSLTWGNHNGFEKLKINFKDFRPSDYIEN